MFKSKIKKVKKKKIKKKRRKKSESWKLQQIINNAAIDKDFRDLPLTLQ